MVSSQSCHPTSISDPQDKTRCLCPESSSCVSSDFVDACLVESDGTNLFSIDCKSCTCVHAPAIYQVSTPTYGTVCYIGETCEVTWTASSSVTDKVLVRLYEEVTSPTTGKKTLKLLKELASFDTNPGKFDWRVEDGTESKDVYKILVLLDTTDLIFASSPIFSISEKPSGPCPTGSFSTDGNYPNCQLCEQGTYSSSTGSTSCQACTSKTTPGKGSKSAADCTVDKADVLAKFVRYDGAILLDQDYQVLTQFSLDDCAVSCDLDMLCKSFDFKPSDTNADIGTCYLSADNIATSLTHTFVSDTGHVHYAKAATTSVVEIGFSKTAKSFIQSTQAVSTQETISLEACAVMCMRSSDCMSFATGFDGRVGECFMYKQTKMDAGDNFITGTGAAALAQLDFYEKKMDQPLCTSGSISITGRGSQCTACAKGTHVSEGSQQTACSPCPSGFWTYTEGAESKDSCEKLSCPVGSNGPDSAYDCRCPSGSDCEGSACVKATVDFFPATCSDCKCSQAIAPPTIDFIFAPKAGEKWYHGGTYDILYQASNGVKNIYVGLYYFSSSTSLSRIGTIASSTANTGKLTVTLSNNIPERSDYSIVIWHVPGPGEQRAPTHRNTAAFYIGPQPVGDCPKGEFNEATGKHPCKLCPVGTYWESPTSCKQCPDQSTTLDPGATSVDDCSILASSALFMFSKTGNSFLSGSNAGGRFLEDADHKTQEECARACLDDAGCKSFDAGTVGQFQEGDCFLSYDTKDTVPDGTYREISQLDYFERKDYKTVLDRGFIKKEGCFIRENDDGGLFENLHSPEACAQLCLNDVCCQSFDAGQIGTSNEFHCFLSYSKQSTVDSKDFVCDNGRSGLDYFEKKVSVELIFGVDFDSISDKAAFGSEVKANILALDSIPDDASIDVTLAKTATGTTQANLLLQSTEVEFSLSTDVSNQKLSLTWPNNILGTEYIASFSEDSGRCGAGTVSRTSSKSEGCHTCRANTYANKAQTKCLPCPAGTTSLPASTNIKACKAPDTGDTKNPFVFGDEWIGNFEFSGTGCPVSICKGALDIQVVKVQQQTVRLRALFYHGLFCDTSKSCRIESAGISEFYLDGTVSGNRLRAVVDRTGNGWGGITDRSFTRYDLDGIVSKDGPNLKYSGSYGPGTFEVVQRCKASEEIGTFNPGDKLIGRYFCDAIVDGKPREGEEDVFRIEFYVESVKNGMVTAVVDFDHSKGLGQYTVEGFYDESSPCSSIEFTPTSDAWITGHPSDVPARQFGGHLSDDGEFLQGEVTLNPNCKCLSKSPEPSNPTRGTSCDDWDGDGSKWCYVGPNCPEGSTTNFDNVFKAPCGNEAQCSTFKVARICSVDKIICPPGFSGSGNRCYKFMSEAATFSTATQLCNNQNAEVVSLHNDADQTFVTDLTGGSVDNFWIGLQKASKESEYEWADGSVLTGYDKWSQGFPNSDETGCGYMDVATKSWKNSPCTDQRTYVCETPTVGVDASCQCNGEVDSDSLGSECRLWNVDVPEDGISKDRYWCHVSEHCPRAVQRTGNSNLYIARCTPPTTTTIPGPTPPPTTPGSSTTMTGTTVTTTMTTTLPSCHQADATQYENELGECADCITETDCETNQILDGQCSEKTTPVCLDCHESCVTCSGVGNDECTSCPTDKFLSSVGGRCLDRCPLGEYGENGKCVACDESCATCSGGTESDCTLCDPDSDLFLTADGQCVSSCPDSFFGDVNSRSCRQCTVCDYPRKYEKEACSETTDTMCEDIVDCPAGQTEDQAPTPTQPRTCKDCVYGTFNPNAGGVCIDATPCSDTQYQTADTTPTSDYKCENLTICQSDEFILVNATDDRDRICKEIQKCKDDEFIASAAMFRDDLDMFISDNECDPCSSCSDETFITSACTATSDTVCEDCDTCVPGQTYETRPCTTGSKRVCDDCTVCEDGYYEFSPCTLVQDRVCTEWTKCDPVTQYEFREPTSKLNRECKQLTTCDPGYVQDKAPTFTSDRTCKPCEEGTYEKAGICRDVSDCPIGMEESQAPNLSSDRECKQCDDGFFKDTIGQANCQEYSPICQRGFVEKTAPTANNDRICVACSVADGFYQDEANQTTCKLLTVCRPGSYVTEKALPAKDRSCTSCPPGTYSDEDNLSECKPCEDGTYQDARGQIGCLPWSECQIGHAIDVFPTDKANTICRLCDGETEYQDEAGQDVCKTVTTCEAPEVEDRPPTAVSDRTCKCGSEYYRPQPNLHCQALTKCGPGQRVLIPATETSDQVCADRAKIGSIEILFQANFQDLLPDDVAKSEFIEAFKEAFSRFQDILQSTKFFVKLLEGSIIADMEVSDKRVVDPIYQELEENALQFSFRGQDLVGTAHGECPSGFVSATGKRPGCTICPANTFSQDSTTCVDCPSGTISTPGSSTASACQTTTTEQGTTEQTTGGNDNNSLPIIIGAVIGGLVLIALIVAIVIFSRRSRGTFETHEVRIRDATKNGVSFVNPVYETNEQGDMSLNDDGDDPGYADLPPSNDPLYDTMRPTDFEDGYADPNPLNLDVDDLDGDDNGYMHVRALQDQGEEDA